MPTLKKLTPTITVAKAKVLFLTKEEAEILFLEQRVIVKDEWSGRVDSIHRDADGSLYATVIDMNDEAFDIDLIEIELDNVA